MVSARRAAFILPGCLFTVLAGSAVGAPSMTDQLLASQCAQCHGTNGQAVSGIASISGKNADEMYKKLLERSTRPPENIMDLQARAFTPAQLRQIAIYIATLVPAESGTGDE
jgi:cytochrome c553